MTAKISVVPIQANYVFQVLPAYAVNQLNSAEGNGAGSSILAQLLDMALSGDVTAAANVANQGTISAITVTTSGGDTYSDAAINTALATAVTDMNALGTKINAILTALQNAGLMLT